MPVPLRLQLSERQQSTALSVAFRTEKDGDQTKNPSVFDHVILKNMPVILNATRYPAVDYAISFPNQKCSRPFGEAAIFRVKFFGMDELITQSNISPNDFYARQYVMLSASLLRQRRPSVCLSVRHTALLCQNDATEDHEIFTV